MKNPRVSTGPASARGRARAAQKQMEHAEKYAPGLSLDMPDEPKGTKPKGMKKGGSVSSASKRADGCATKGKTRGKMI
jgi:hypothetical protein